MIAEQLPSTAQLTLVAIPLAVLFGGSLGLLAALKRGTWIDTITMSIAIAGFSIPNFWLGILLIMIFAVTLNWLPSVAPGNDLRGLILPAITLAVAEGAVIARVTRTSMLEVLDQQYMTTTRSNGLKERSILFVHALPNALIPVITILDLQIGFLLVGAIVVETIFARQGLGRLTITAINNRDFPLVQGIVLVTASIYVLINTITDLTYGFLDPRAGRLFALSPLLAQVGAPAQRHDRPFAADPPGRQHAPGTGAELLRADRHQSRRSPAAAQCGASDGHRSVRARCHVARTVWWPRVASRRPDRRGDWSGRRYIRRRSGRVLL
jgi:ABC-type amino acid transport system permease subunit